MPQLLLELLSEEIPARMQAQAARDLERLAREKLADAGLLPEALTAFAGPRRLTLAAEGLPPAQPDRTEERKGPRVGAPDQAIDGFLRSTGLTRDQLTEREGVWFAVMAKTGRPTSEIIAEMVEAIVRGFPWPKSMTSGASKLRWVRPLRRILCTFDGEIVPINIDGIRSGDLSQGHRFMGSRQAFRARTFEDYADGLNANFVVLDPKERKTRITEAAKTLCFARNLELVEDVGLLDEVAGLTEWPVPILGDMDPAFLDLPPEVIRTSMRVHQRYFAVKNPATGELAPHFIAVANIQATDGGKTIAEGNARVLTARLKDAQFFWENDKSRSADGTANFDRWLKKLEGVTFHTKLGTMAERVERITALAGEIAQTINVDQHKAEQAAALAKADLASGMVGEFPELQGIMGGYYARKAGLPDDIADAIRDHYRPAGPNDVVPTAPVTVAVALADKLDTLAGFFAIGEKPTGSRDPYALRRAALGVIRLLIAGDIRLSLLGWAYGAEATYAGLTLPLADAEDAATRLATSEIIEVRPPGWLPSWPAIKTTPTLLGSLDLRDRYWRYVSYWHQISDLLAFFADRLKVQLRDEGKRHDLVDAVFALGDDDLVRIVARVEALDGFLKTLDGRNLLAGYKRAANILKAEIKKNPGEADAYAGAVDPARLEAPEEKALHAALQAATPKVATELQAEHFESAMAALAGLRGPVDEFFDRVLVNADDAAVRQNRLRLLSAVQGAMGQVADFSLVAG
jgi:glycyl-tRNA synthetase beta chain